ncbi:MAG: hypothetical protein M1839_004439 [Geoglossum umbratile]|nr:MAG: hypothetical protein M1839_004439 [Geoglossum umbratile]
MPDLSSAVSPPSLPSPTLTNPDMILPYNQGYLRTSTPSPPPESTRPPSPPLAARALNSHPPFAQLARPPAGRKAASPMVTPPLESYSAGGLLPDIEEVETTPKAQKPKQKMWRRPGSRSPPLVSSPTLEFTPSQHRGNYSPAFFGSDRRPSNTASVTSEESSLNGFENFDDAFSMDGDGIFPDEDEELSGSASEGHGYQTHSATGSGADTSSARDSKTSHVALSRRAERILASAKRRLDHMEGNLSRARHSLIISPSPSMSPSSANRYSPPYSAASPPSTDADGGMILIHPPLGVSPAKHRQLHSTTSNGSPGHSRVFSETSVPSSLYSSPQPPHIIGRSTSAQGMVGTARSPRDGLNPPVVLSISKTRSDEHFHVSRESAQMANSHSLSYSHSLSASNVGSSHGSYSAPLTPSSRDGTLQSHGRDLLFSNGSTSRPLLSPSSSNGQSIISRSQSTAQMRDLRDQMKDLKGKISSLQQRAREDGLRRRSLQSLRTPSPFTAAEAWYTGANGYAEGGLSANAGVGVAERHHKAGHVAGEKINGQGPGQGSSDADQRELAHYGDDERRTNEEDDVQGPGNSDGGEEEGFRQSEPNDESDPERSTTESPIDPELQPSIVGERHEDRADAFDYEHFFLHSSAGNYELPLSGRQSRPTSYSSNGSTSTTKIMVATSQPVSEYQQQSNGNWRRSGVILRVDGADGEVSPKPYLRRTHARQDSVSSISTYATFATATEGRGSGENSEDEDEDEPIRSRQIMSNGLGVSTPNTIFGPPADTSTGAGDRNWQEAGSDRSGTPTTVRGANSSPNSPSSTAKPNGKATPTSSSPGDRSTSSTPVGTSRSFPLVNKPRQIFPRPLPSTRAFLSGRSGRSGSLGAYGADGAEGALILNKEDRALVEGLVETLKKACRHLNDSDPQKAGDWRRKLEDARKLLEGDDDWKGRR